VGLRWNLYSSTYLYVTECNKSYATRRLESASLMSTQGLFGLVVGGQLKVAYNHFDSYTEGLGLAMLGAARRIASGRAHYTRKASKLKVVDDRWPPSMRQRRQLDRFADDTMRVDDKPNWHMLLRKLQGDLLGILDCGYIRDYSHFAERSMFCPHAWIVDMDEWFFECYRGGVLVTSPLSQGRFAPEAEIDCPQGQPIHLLGKFDMDNLPTNDEFVQRIAEWHADSAIYFGERCSE
jgi:hypothetical protein